jgi:hypothetical protein
MMILVSAREASELAPPVPTPGRYRHFKGGEYDLLRVARHTETKELLAVYCSVEDPAMTWVRPLEMFSGVIERPEGTFPRFEPTVVVNSRASSRSLARLLRWLRTRSRKQRAMPDLHALLRGTPTHLSGSRWQ